MSVRVLGLDVSTCTGYAFWETSEHISAIQTGVIELPEAKSFIVFEDGKEKRKPDYHWDDWRVAQVGPKIYKLLKSFKPDFVLVEERLRFSKTGDGGFAMTNAIHGSIYSHCCTMGVLFGTIAVNSWRAAAYPDGFKRPLLPDLDRQKNQKRDEEGKLLFKKKDWGDIAVEKCESLDIILRAKNDIAHNAAEAALIAMIWRCKNRINIPEKRAHNHYIELLQRPNSKDERTAA